MSRMSPESQRIAIAEFLGWKLAGRVMDKLLMFPPEHGDWAHPPDYPNDLSACADFEAHLTDAQWQIYALHLGPLTSSRVKHYIGATAEQRCGAFLRTLNLWKENQ